MAPPMAKALPEPGTLKSALEAAADQCLETPKAIIDTAMKKDEKLENDRILMMLREMLEGLRCGHQAILSVVRQLPKPLLQQHAKAAEAAITQPPDVIVDKLLRIVPESISSDPGALETSRRIFERIARHRHKLLTYANIMEVLSPPVRSGDATSQEEEPLEAIPDEDANQEADGASDPDEVIEIRVNPDKPGE